MPHPLWPLYDLRLRTDQLELRLPTDDEIVELCAVARAGIHPPDAMPFGFAWTDKPSPRFEREYIQWHWKARADWTPGDWHLELGVFLAGRPIGCQELHARDFAVLRRVGTGSWLGLAHQRQGLGKEMRTAVLGLAFDGLHAEVAETEAFLDNPASAGVSRALGYAPNGTGRMAPRGVARDMFKFRMTRELWLGRARGRIAIEGLEACRDLFGLDAAG